MSDPHVITVLVFLTVFLFAFLLLYIIFRLCLMATWAVRRAWRAMR